MAEIFTRKLNYVSTNPQIAAKELLQQLNYLQEEVDKELAALKKAQKKLEKAKKEEAVG